MKRNQKHPFSSLKPFDEDKKLTPITSNKETKKNDRLLATFDKSETYRSVKSIDDLEETVVHQVEHFFISYHKFNNVDFRPLARRDVRKARAIIQAGQKAFNKNRSSKSKKM
jgi:inorganic pyrophosphatase